MGSRRVESIVFALILAAPFLAYLVVSTRTEEAAPRGIEIPLMGAELDLPAVDLPEPFFVFRRGSGDASRRVRRPVVGDEMESALIAVRTELLASSVPSEVASAD